jgi:hypothetical protein
MGVRGLPWHLQRHEAAEQTHVQSTPVRRRFRMRVQQVPEGAAREKAGLACGQLYATPSAWAQGRVECHGVGREEVVARTMRGDVLAWKAAGRGAPRRRPRVALRVHGLGKR